MGDLPEVEPRDLARELAGSEPPRLLDVRELDELEICRLDGIVHIPMHDVPLHLADLDAEADWVIVCRSGRRSASVTEYLLAHGFARVRNLRGGMLRWAADVDPAVRTY